MRLLHRCPRVTRPIGGWRNQRGFSVYFEGRNLTDEKYAATTGVISQASAFNQAQFLPGDGRGFYGGVEFKW